MRNLDVNWWSAEKQSRSTKYLLPPIVDSVISETNADTNVRDYDGINNRKGNRSTENLLSQLHDGAQTRSTYVSI